MEVELNEVEARTPKWAVRKRLEYIDFRLFWDGRFNRSELANAFGMSPQQASADIAEYQRLAGGNLAYDLNEKAYVRGPNFAPALIAESADRFLLQLVAIASKWMDLSDTWFANRPPVEVVSLERPPTNPAHLMAVLDAIRDKRELNVDYRSMTGSPAAWRRVAPHCMAYAGGRWYVRAWSRDHNDFRDYNLNRIRGVELGQSADVDFALDYEWAQKIDLRLSPNPGLSEERRRAVSEELGMVDGALVVPVRLSLSFYLMTEHNLDLEPGILKPERQQLVLENREDVEAARRLARQMSVQALQRSRTS